MPYKIAVCEKLCKRTGVKIITLLCFRPQKPFFLHPHGRNFDGSQRQASACLVSLFLFQIQWVSLCSFDYRDGVKRGSRDHCLVPWPCLPSPPMGGHIGGQPSRVPQRPPLTSLLTQRSGWEAKQQGRHFGCGSQRCVTWGMGRPL